MDFQCKQSHLVLEKRSHVGFLVQVEHEKSSATVSLASPVV